MDIENNSKDNFENCPVEEDFNDWTERRINEGYFPTEEDYYDWRNRRIEEGYFPTEDDINRDYSNEIYNTFKKVGIRNPIKLAHTVFKSEGEIKIEVVSALIKLSPQRFCSMLNSKEDSYRMITSHEDEFIKAQKEGNDIFFTRNKVFEPFSKDYLGITVHYLDFIKWIETNYKLLIGYQFQENTTPVNSIALLEQIEKCKTENATLRDKLAKRDETIAELREAAQDSAQGAEPVHDAKLDPRERRTLIEIAAALAVRSSTRKVDSLTSWVKTQIQLTGRASISENTIRGKLKEIQEVINKIPL